MEMISVNSRTISRIGYEENTGLLRIEFLDGAEYEYYDVPQYEYDGLMSASSQGKYAHQNIYKKYKQSKIR
jgi:hypothetical protein